MMVVHAGEPAKARIAVGVALVDIPDRVRLGDAAAFLNHLLGGRAQPLDPAVRQELLQQDVAVLEVVLALPLRQHARLDGQDFLRRHRTLPFLGAPRPTGASDISAVYQILVRGQRRCQTLSPPVIPEAEPKARLSGTSRSKAPP